MGFQFKPYSTDERFVYHSYRIGALRQMDFHTDVITVALRHNAARRRDYARYFRTSARSAQGRALSANQSCRDQRSQSNLIAAH